MLILVAASVVINTLNTHCWSSCWYFVHFILPAWEQLEVIHILHTGCDMYLDTIVYNKRHNIVVTVFCKHVSYCQFIIWKMLVESNLVVNMPLQTHTPQLFNSAWFKELCTVLKYVSSQTMLYVWVDFCIFSVNKSIPLDLVQNCMSCMIYQIHLLTCSIFTLSDHDVTHIILMMHVHFYCTIQTSPCYVYTLY